MSEFNTGDRVKVVDYNLELELDPGLNPIGRVGTVVPSPYDDDVYIWVVLDGLLSSSITHGQKFWGLRSETAFLMTAIFMILLQLGYMADRPL